MRESRARFADRCGHQRMAGRIRALHPLQLIPFEEHSSFSGAGPEASPPRQLDIRRRRRLRQARLREIPCWNG